MDNDTGRDAPPVADEPVEATTEETSDETRRSFIRGIGKTAALFAAAGLSLRCGDDGGDPIDPGDDTPLDTGDDTPVDDTGDDTPIDDTGDTGDTGDDTLPDDVPIELENVLIGEVQDGVMVGYSPTTGVEREVIPSACWQCVARDAILCHVEDGRLVHVEGNPNLLRGNGKLCARGQGGVGQVYDPDRLLFPMRRVAGTARGDHKWERISWDEALAELAGKLAAVRDTAPEKLAYHYGRQKASASKVLKSMFCYGFGTKSIFNHTSICESAKWTSQELVWGKHYDVNDVENSNVILNFGCNPLVAHTNHLALGQRVAKAIHAGTPLYTFDVRLSNTAARSTEWLPVMPGTDLAVVLAMLYHIVTEDLAPQSGKDFIDTWSNTSVADIEAVLTDPQGYIGSFGDLHEYWDPADQPAGGFTPAWAEGISGVPAEKIIELAELYANNSPGSTIISYRGAVMHFNGVLVENAIQMLEGLCGNIDVPGGRVFAVGASWNYKGTYGTASSSGLSKIDLNNTSAYIKNSHGSSHQVLDMFKAAAPEDRPEIYMVYCYTPAYANGDMQGQIDILKDESIIPYAVTIDVAYTEAVMYADLVLPDANYLERWDWEDMVSNNMIHEFYIRQPAIQPLGEARDFKDVAVELAGMLSKGGDDKLEPLASMGSAENYVKAACLDTAVIDEAGKAKGYADGWEFMKAEGAYYDPDQEPIYESYLTELDLDITDPDTIADDDENEYIFVDDEGIAWETTKAEFTNTGYRASKSAYKHYKGQLLGDKFYKGFKPDKINKSGLFELDSPILTAKHYPGLPVWMYIPEHQDLADDELILTTFKIANQTHSRTQNCKYLTELTHHNPAWLNAQTAAELGIQDGDTIKITRTKELLNSYDLDPAKAVGTVVSEMEVEVNVTEAIHPRTIAISHHLGHWAYGRYASGNAHPLAGDDTEQADHVADDPDASLMWWNKFGYRPNWLMPNAGDPISGAQRVFDTVVKVEKA